ncbi:MAG: HAMP domain-containing histidine kinase [Planctomycetes bacterium]|nr:HAMP domain-containing histidine kinase [Planctomycetota bacterium]
MSIRAKITLFVLVVGLSEAVLLGVIGYNSVSSVSRNAAELRRIGSAIEGTRALNVALSRLSDPVEFLLRNERTASDRFGSHMDELERRVSTCAATSCHGYEKRPPEMAGQVIRDLRTIRGSGTKILVGRGPGVPPPLEDWAEGVDGPSRKVSEATGQMAETLTAKAKELESASRETERAALFLVGTTTVFCIFVAVALCHPIAGGITRPLENLADQSRRIAEGDLTLRAAETGPRETVRLARSFNLMLDDLSKQRNALLNYQNELERTVEERVSELRQKDEELKRSEQSAGIGLVAGAVAHDLNNPLSNILLNAESLLDSMPESSPGREIAMDIMRDAQRCREIAYEIRTLGRENEVEFLPCRLDQIAAEAVRHLRFKWKLRDIQVRCELGKDLPECLCNAPRILQLLVNLMSNGIDASPDHGEITVRLDARDEKIILEVEDGGSGIPPECRDSLFKPFFTTKVKGTGLGLAISRRIVQQHGGTIECRTRTVAEAAGKPPPGHGTLFRIQLPLTKRNSSSGPHECQGCHPGGR